MSYELLDIDLSSRTYEAREIPNEVVAQFVGG